MGIWISLDSHLWISRDVYIYILYTMWTIYGYLGISMIYMIWPWRLTQNDEKWPSTSPLPPKRLHFETTCGSGNVLPLNALVNLTSNHHVSDLKWPFGSGNPRFLQPAQTMLIWQPYDDPGPVSWGIHWWGWPNHRMFFLCLPITFRQNFETNFNYISTSTQWWSGAFLK